MFNKVKFSAREFLGWVFLVWLSLHPLTAIAAGTYAASAHGNTGYGVLRTILDGVYLCGNCGHCHEQHSADADGYLLIADGFDSTQTTNLYDQSDNVCFYCHVSTGSVQFSGGITNNNYSTTFGGATTYNTTGIMKAFNAASYHNLFDIKRYITGTGSDTKTFSNFPPASNPCSGCHNIHIAKANKHTPGDPTNTAISKPSDHDSLWGDDTLPNERMTVYGTAYQPPLYANLAPNLEPDGVSSDKTTQAAKTPDYNAFCTDCHNSTNIIYSTTLARNLRTINWSMEKHGEGNADTYIDVDSPYTAGSSALGYVLACTDCHEPHGAANSYLIRPTVNGAALSNSISGFSTTGWISLCARCHVDNNESIHHALNDYPYTKAQCGTCHTGYPMPCTNCHFHGSSKTNCRTPATRRTF